MSKQEVLHPRPDLTLLGVVVPKDGTDHYLSHEDDQIYYYKNHKLTATSSYPFGRIYFLPEYRIIGLVSQITEEQAKELVNKSMNYNSRNGYVGIEQYQSYKDPIIYYNTAIAALESLIESSGLTVTKEEDVLLIKIENK